MNRINNYFKLIMLVTLLVSACSSAGDGAEQTNEPNVPDGEGGGFGVSNVIINSTEILIMESYPIQVALIVSGELPTPCHVLQTIINDPDEQNRILIEVLGVIDDETVCTQVMEPFEERIGIPMQGSPDGVYEIWLNGELVGDFSYPGG
ncbi:MAG: hypothetical protein FVQ83_13580 [Chloroflexi bacterium]|nr:hypothetical protein [Chloroflexota bacterium]